MIPTTRSLTKSRETILNLRRRTREFAETSQLLQSRAGPSYNPRDTTRRVHVLSVQLDLCNFPSIRKAAGGLIHGSVSNPDGDGDADADDSFAPLVDVRVPRLDAVIFNAGIGGWTGLAWPKVFTNFLTKGIIEATTWPTFKAALVGRTIHPVPGDDTAVGEVFCANVLGHYLLAHALVPLLARPAASDLAPGRIIWESSIEGGWHHLSFDDFQALRVQEAYESSKRLTDALCLTATLPASRPYVAGFLHGAPSSSSSSEAMSAAVPPRLYVTHPGVVQTSLFPLNAFMFFWYRVILYVTRWLGSPWHPITGYNGAVAPVWVALQEQASLDAAGAERVKWGSATDRAGNPRVKKTEVEGWGWDGRVQSRDEETVTGVMRRSVGRRANAVDLTEEKRIEFEALGARCWREMERLRAEWEKRMEASQ